MWIFGRIGKGNEHLKPFAVSGFEQHIFLGLLRQPRDLLPLSPSDLASMGPLALDRYIHTILRDIDALGLRRDGERLYRQVVPKLISVEPGCFFVG